MLIQHKIEPGQWVLMHDDAAKIAQELITKEMKAIEIAAGRPQLIVNAPSQGGSSQVGPSAAGTTTPPSNPAVAKPAPKPTASTIDNKPVIETTNTLPAASNPSRR
jgi:hypothetical protein